MWLLHVTISLPGSEQKHFKSLYSLTLNFPILLLVACLLHFHNKWSLRQSCFLIKCNGQLVLNTYFPAPERGWPLCCFKFFNWLWDHNNAWPSQLFTLWTLCSVRLQFLPHTPWSALQVLVCCCHKIWWSSQLI